MASNADPLRILKVRMMVPSATTGESSVRMNSVNSVGELLPEERTVFFKTSKIYWVSGSDTTEHSISNKASFPDRTKWYDIKFLMYTNGIEVYLSEEKLVKIPLSNALVKDWALSLQHNGVEFEMVSWNFYADHQSSIKAKESRTRIMWILIVVGLVVTSGVVGGLVLLNSKKKKNTELSEQEVMYEL